MSSIIKGITQEGPVTKKQPDVHVPGYGTIPLDMLKRHVQELSKDFNVLIQQGDFLKAAYRTEQLYNALMALAKALPKPNKVDEGEVVSLEARRSPLVIAGSPYDWDIYDLRTNKMVANILGGDRHESPLYEIRIRSSGMTPTTRMPPTYVLRAGRNNNPPYKAYELVDTADRYGKIEKSPGPGGTTKLHPDQDDVLRHMMKSLGGGKYYGYDLDLVEEGLDQYQIIEKALGAKIMEIDDAMELGFTDIDPEDSSSIIYLGNKKNEGYSAGASGGAGLGEAHPKQQLSLYKPDGNTYRGKPMPNLEKDPVDKARKLSKNIPADLPDPDEDIRQKQLKKTINDLINSELIDREQKVLKAYYFGEKTLEQIAKQFQVHPSRIAQILAKAERKLRHPARASKLRPFLQPELSEEQAPMFTPEEKMVNANDPMSDGWRLYKLKDEQQLDEKCWDTHKQVGMKKKGGKMVPNCVPKESAIMKGLQAENESSKRK